MFLLNYFKFLVGFRRRIALQVLSESFSTSMIKQDIGAQLKELLKTDYSFRTEHKKFSYSTYVVCARVRHSDEANSKSTKYWFVYKDSSSGAKSWKII